MRRKHALSEWLAQTSSPSVEDDLRSPSRASVEIFRMLSGHQVERATEKALASGDLNLATLIAQIGGDPSFRADIEDQLVKWKDQTIDAHIDEAYKKIYALLAGVVDLIPASTSSDPAEKAKDVLVAKPLDWKRAFGLHLWYGTQLDDSVAEAVSSYDEAVHNSTAAAPVAWYEESKNVSDRKWQIESQHDGLYSLLRLDTEDSLPLEDVLSPRGFSASPLDYRLSWLLSLVLSRGLNPRNFSDAGSSVSMKSSQVTTSFASQLEQQGLWEFAIFVLLHLEQREK